MLWLNNMLLLRFTGELLWLLDECKCLLVLMGTDADVPFCFTGFKYLVAKYIALNGLWGETNLNQEEAAGRGAEHRPLGEPASTAPDRQLAQPKQTSADEGVVCLPTEYPLLGTCCLCWVRAAYAVYGVSRVEVAVGDMRDRLDVQEEHVEELNDQDEELKGEVQEIVREMLENVVEPNSQLESVVEILQRELEDLRTEVWIELRKQFYPEYAMDKARGKLCRLVQKGDVREYVWEFSDLALQVGDLGEKEALFTFMDGLKPWGKQELQRRGVQDLTRAMAVAEGLIDYSRLDKDRIEPAKPRDKGKGWADKGKQSRDEDGPYFVRDCPKRAKLVAIASEEEEQQGDETVRLGSMQLEAVCKGGKRAKGLIYADMVVAGQQVEALVDMGVSDLFVSEQGAVKLGLKADSAGGWVKTVNSKWVRTKGIAKGIDVQLGEWHWTEDIEVIQMDDYKVVMGLDFLERIQAFLVPHNDCICILGSKGQCIVLVRRGCAQPTKTLSAIQLVEGEQICAAVRSLEDTPNSIVEAPDEVLEVSEHQSGGANPVAGEPSREATPPASSKVRAELLPHIKEGKTPDPIEQPILESAEVENARLVHVSDGLRRAKVDRPHKPQHEGLRKLSLKECHDICGAGHSRIHRTLVSCPPCSTRHAGSRESSMTSRKSAVARPRGGVQMTGTGSFGTQQGKSCRRSRRGRVRQRPMPDGAARQNIDTRARGRVSRHESAHDQESREGAMRMSAQLKHPRARRALETAEGPRVSEGSNGEVPAKDPDRPTPPAGKVSSVRPKLWDAQEAQGQGAEWGAEAQKPPGRISGQSQRASNLNDRASRVAARGAWMDSAGHADRVGGARRTLTTRERLVRAHMRWKGNCLRVKQDGGPRRTGGSSDTRLTSSSRQRGRCQLSQEEAAGKGAEHRPLGEPTCTAPDRQPAQLRQTVCARPRAARAPSAYAACLAWPKHSSPLL
ncbi:Uncharacterized protein TCM_017282 [Theobroma cacao]|uniref:Retrotransposon gag domain-containing protein n=1 Tax=Theobroma cacao TaxID=3641 RepID=A0A061ED18_THECC|nr:Uncharacterized protein TCM_017282 [Theobroma cacao]